MEFCRWQGAMTQTSLQEVQPKLGLGWRVLLALVLIAVVAMGVGGLRRATRTDAGEVNASVEELMTISPVLERGSFSYEEEQPSFTGTVLLASWTVMTQDQHKQAADAIRAALAAKNIQKASVYRGESVAIQIGGGKVLFVE